MNSTAGAERRSVLSSLLDLPAALAGGIAAGAVSRRGYSLWFLLGAAILCMTGWVRPPLSPDIRGHHISLGIFNRELPPVEQLLHEPRHFCWDSPGALLLVVIASASLPVLWRPRLLAPLAGLICAMAIAANATLALNRPDLVEVLDSELVQRQQMVELLTALEPNSLSGRIVGRIKPLYAETTVLQGLSYLTYGGWLVVWSACGVLFGVGGSLRRRVGHLAVWVVLGLASSLLICLPRIRSDWNWRQAELAEWRDDWAESRRIMEVARHDFAAMSDLVRIRLQVGRLDFREGINSKERLAWEAGQLLRRGEYSKAVGALDTLGNSAAGDRSIQRYAALLLARTGLDLYGGSRPTAAGEMWRRALELDPWRWDCRLFLAMLDARQDRDHPELIEAEYGPLLTRLADRSLRADILANLGDAYFAAGNWTEARRNYELSLKAFELPKDINYRARNGLMGM